MTMAKNYRGEDFNPLTKLKLDADLLQIVQRVQKNFTEPGLFVSVSDFRGDVSTKHKLGEMVKANYRKHQKHLAEKEDRKDHPGIYVFAEIKGDSFVCKYAGITRMAIQRLRQHTSYTGKGSATWAYLLIGIYVNG